MGTEIERKFLVRGTTWESGDGGQVYVQGYLSDDKACTVRVRVTPTKGKLTIKGATQGATRAEFEYTIPRSEAEQMLTLCQGRVVSKVRHRITVGAHVWELDVFDGANQGLVMAEIELSAEDEAFTLPDWAGDEVTHDSRYYNACLATHPFTRW